MVNHNRREDSFIRQVNEIIASNLNNDRFGVSELAGMMNMSRSNLHRRINGAA
jgi:AraC-like DNA-binding protein